VTVRVVHCRPRAVAWAVALLGRRPRSTAGVALGTALDRRGEPRRGAAMRASSSPPAKGTPGLQRRRPHSAAIRALASVLVDFTRPERHARGMSPPAVAAARRGRYVIGNDRIVRGSRSPPIRGKRQSTIAYRARSQHEAGGPAMNVALKLVELCIARAWPRLRTSDDFVMHHKLKVDAPTGTALEARRKSAAKARGTTLEKDGVFTRHGRHRRAQGRNHRLRGRRGVAMSFGHHRCSFASAGGAHRDHASRHEPLDLRAGRQAPLPSVVHGATSRFVRHWRTCSAFVDDFGACATCDDCK
jgi:4-hydroxy-tetrahydrodipicolinate reductase